MTILDKIIDVKRREVAILESNCPVGRLREITEILPQTRDFMQAISGKDCAVIAEVKKRSPSKGSFRKIFDPVGVASEYEQNRASAVSVLTDETFFGGKKEYLNLIRKAVNLPLLRKDFIISMYQIYETRAIGGDALLLIAGILKEKELASYICLAESLGLVSLVEVHSLEDLQKAVNAGATIIGINNRNLTTFHTDISVSESLAPLIPPGVTVVSESGIRSKEDVNRLMKKGIHAFLIGETLMSAPNIGEKLRELVAC